MSEALPEFSFDFLPDSSTALHLRALQAARDYRSAESELVEVIRLVDRARVFLDRGHPSLFQYVVSELGLGESVAYAVITVARKANEVPELARKIQEGRLSVSQARKIVPVLTSVNSGEWLAKASELSQRKLEKEVAKVRPETRTPERASYVSASRVKLELGLPEAAMLDLRRVQDLLSQNRKMAVSLEETLSALTREYLARHDPVEKAKRHQVRKGKEASTAAADRPTYSERAPKNETAEAKDTPLEKPTPSLKTLDSNPVRGNEPKQWLRTPILAAMKHQVHLRDQGQCTHQNIDGKRCTQRRWIEIHHKTPISEGGTHALANLTTLCSAHHQFAHQGHAHRASCRSIRVVD